MSFDDANWKDAEFHQKALWDIQVGANFTYPSVYFGDIANQFYGIMGTDGNVKLEFPNGGRGGRQLVVSDENCTVAKVTLLGPNQRVSGTTECSMTNYLPTNRPWYQTIDSVRTKVPKDRQVWSPFYLFQGRPGDPPSLGITVSQAVYTKSGDFVGVVGVDLTLRNLNTYLTTMPATSGTRIFIIDDGELLVASSADTGAADGQSVEWRPAGPAGPLVRHHMKDYPVEAVNRIYQIFGDNLAGVSPDILVKTDFKGKFGLPNWEYVGTRVISSRADNLVWTVITLIPENEAAGDLDDPGKISGGCAGIVLAVTFVTSGLVVWLVYPVSRFASDMEKVSQGTLQTSDFYKTRLSVVSEITRMQKALAQILSASKGGYETSYGGPPLESEVGPAS